ncbi:MAG: beta-ketoacyl-ACP synthase II [Actinobacteria bacterium]|nr:beta-ketoacyl-ACP synthase II [Actinomycetota bacterium]
MNLNRVVVTGMGLVTPLGNNLDTYWNNLISGKSGIGSISLIDATNHATKIAGEIKDFEPLEFIDKKDVRRMDRFTQLAIVATEKAISHSKLNFDNVDRDQAGVIVSSGIGGMATYERECKKLIDNGPRRVSPFFIPMLILDITPGYISIRHGLRGVNYSTVSACASASHAIGDAFHHIRHGRAQVIITGGSEASLTQMGIAGFNALKALSTRNDEPEKASRPFDLNRDGFVMGEGAGILVLEDLQHAKARGATIYGEIVGTGFTADAYHITAPAPDGNGATRAMKLAIKEANLTTDDVDYINAHGTSTQQNDKIETLAIKNVFGKRAYDIPISSTKSMIGHLLGASGAVEAIASLLTIHQSEIHPTANYETPDPNCDLNYVPGKPIKKDVNVVISNSFGFGGHNATLAFKKYLE